MAARLIGSIIVVGAAIAGLVLGGEYQPTLTNALAHGYVLKQSAYDAVRIGGYLGIVCGAVVLLSSIITTEPAAAQRNALAGVLAIGGLAALVSVALPVIVIADRASMSDPLGTRFSSAGTDTTGATDTSGNTDTTGTAGSTTLDAGSVESAIKSNFPTIQSISCPSGVPIATGRTFTCMASNVDGSTTQYNATETDNNGHFNVAPAAAGTDTTGATDTSGATATSPTPIPRGQCAPPTGPGDNLVHSAGLRVTGITCSQGRTVALACTKYTYGHSGSCAAAGYTWTCTSKDVGVPQSTQRCESGSRVMAIVWLD